MGFSWEELMRGLRPEGLMFFRFLKEMVCSSSFGKGDIDLKEQRFVWMLSGVIPYNRLD